MKVGAVSAILPACVNSFLAQFVFFAAVSDKIWYRRSSSSSCEFRLPHSDSCGACKACLISEAPSPADVHISCKQCSSTVQSVAYPTDSTAVTILEGVVSEVAYLDTVKACTTSAIAERVSFEWFWLTGCSVLVD
jgi:hypothetical protein